MGLHTFIGQYLQEVVRMVLEAIYEGYFEWTSHGFRPHKSCHTILYKQSDIQTMLERYYNPIPQTGKL